MKYRTIVDNINVKYQDEIVETLKKGTIIEVETILPAKDIYNRNIEIAILKDGKEITSKNIIGRDTIEIYKKGSKK